MALRFDDHMNLVIDFVDGGSAEITGAPGAASIQALANPIAELRGDDLLKFGAVTRNKVADGGVKVSPARIEPAGNWDLQKDRFLVNRITGDLSAAEDEIGLAGKVRGTEWAS